MPARARNGSKSISQTSTLPPSLATNSEPAAVVCSLSGTVCCWSHFSTVVRRSADAAPGSKTCARQPPSRWPWKSAYGNAASARRRSPRWPLCFPKRWSLPGVSSPVAGLDCPTTQARSSRGSGEKICSSHSTWQVWPPPAGPPARADRSTLPTCSSRWASRWSRRSAACA